MSALENLPVSRDVINAMMRDAIADAEQIIAERARRTVEPAHLKYQNNPVGFGRSILGEKFTDDVVRVMESVRDFPVTIARSANGVGKTHAAARIAVWFYKVFPGAQVYTAAAPPEGNLKRLLWGEIDSILRGHPKLFVNDTTTIMNIERSKSEFITGVTIPMTGTDEQREARFSGKHAPHLLFIVDEGDAVPDTVYRGIESCMSGGHARLLIMFNPRAKVGPIYRKERDRQANVVEMTAFSHPNVITGTDVFPGAVTRETVLRRINEYSRLQRPDETDTSSTFSPPDYLVGEVGISLSKEPYPPLPAGKRTVTNSALSYMVLARYPSQGTEQLIDEEWVNAARLRWDLYVKHFGLNPPKAVTGILGLDVAEFGDDLNCSCIRFGGLVLPLKGWGKVDVAITATNTVNILTKTKNVTRVFIDATGVGSGVGPSMRENMKLRGIRYDRGLLHSVKVAASPTYKVEFGEFSQLRDQLWWSVREWLRTDPLAMLPPDEELIEELTTPSYERLTSNGKIKITTKKVMKTKIGRSPNKADALALTFAPEKPAFRVAFI